MLKRKTILVIVGLIMTTFSHVVKANTDVAQRHDNTVLSGIPYFTYDMATAGCTYEGRINDVLDYPKLMSGSISDGTDYASYPITDLMTSGENTISVKISPAEQYKKLINLGAPCNIKVSLQIESPKDSGDYVTVGKIVYRSANAGQITNEPIKLKDTTPAGRYNSNNDFSADENGDVIIAPLRVKTFEGKYGTGVELFLDITLPMKDFPRWPWFDGDTIKNDQATKDSLYEQYQIIWQAIHDNNLKRIKPMLDFRDSRTAKALSIPASDIISGSSTVLIQQDIDDPNYKLIKLLEEKNTYLFINGNGKLARLLTSPSSKTPLGINQTPIGFHFKKEHNVDFYDFIFYRKDGKWILN